MIACWNSGVTKIFCQRCTSWPTGRFDDSNRSRHPTVFAGDGEQQLARLADPVHAPRALRHCGERPKTTPCSQIRRSVQIAHHQGGQTLSLSGPQRALLHAATQRPTDTYATPDRVVAASIAADATPRARTHRAGVGRIRICATARARTTITDFIIAQHTNQPRMLANARTAQWPQRTRRRRVFRRR